DGVLLISALFGMTGSPLTVAALGTGATRTAPAEIVSYLQVLHPLLDIDANVDPATDGLLVMRYLFGLRGDPLIAGALGGSPTRTMPGDIEAYIQSLM